MPFSRERWRALELRRLNPCCDEKRVCHNAWDSRRVSKTLRARYKRVSIFCYTVMSNNDVAWISLFLFSRSSTISEKINVKLENITRRFTFSHGTGYRVWEVGAARAGCEVMCLQEACKVQGTWFIFIPFPPWETWNEQKACLKKRYLPASTSNPGEPARGVVLQIGICPARSQCKVGMSHVVKHLTDTVGRTVVVSLDMIFGHLSLNVQSLSCTSHAILLSPDSEWWLLLQELVKRPARSSSLPTT